MFNICTYIYSLYVESYWYRCSSTGSYASRSNPSPSFNPRIITPPQAAVEQLYIQIEKIRAKKAKNKSNCDFKLRELSSEYNNEKGGDMLSLQKDLLRKRVVLVTFS